MPLIQRLCSTQLVCGIVAIALSSALAPALAKPSVVVSNQATQPVQTNQARRRQIFTPPPAPKTGQARNSRGTATRSGACPVVEIPLTALIPVYKTDAGDRVALGLTTSDYPTLWFYVPYAITAETPAELRLETPEPGTSATTQRTVLHLTQLSPGIVGIKIPPSEAPLQVGQQSDWTFVVHCKPNDTSTIKYAELSLKRVEPNTITNQAESKTKAQITRYANAGLWENAFTLLAQLRSQSPQDAELADYWADLFQAIALPELATQPLINNQAATQTKAH